MLYLISEELSSTGIYILHDNYAIKTTGNCQWSAKLHYTKKLDAVVSAKTSGSENGAISRTEITATRNTGALAWYIFCLLNTLYKKLSPRSDQWTPDQSNPRTETKADVADWETMRNTTYRGKLCKCSAIHCCYNLCFQAGIRDAYRQSGRLPSMKGNTSPMQPFHAGRDAVKYV